MLSSCHSSITLPSGLNRNRGLCAFPRTVTHRPAAFSIGVTMPNKPTIEVVKARLKSSIKIDSNGCWNWTKKLDGHGYGCAKYERKCIGTHRLSYKLFIGEIPAGMLVCHHCDNPPCCNPEHLFLGTNQDNSNDKVRKGRHTYGEDCRSTKLTKEQVMEIRGLALSGAISQGELGERFGVCQTTIYAVVSGRTWKHL